ncbi:MAG: hypothetical protein BHW55_00180 [Candidatus Melainabacteria bacterium 35_41]|nr:MAG: hypothetical protein BHW55_00180 [Candidatus Melainabacteria bacterium 35_41]
MNNKKLLFEYIPLIVTALFWFFTINGLPARVTALETDVRDLKIQFVRNDEKTNIILEDVKFLKQVALEGSKSK